LLDHSSVERNDKMTQSQREILYLLRETHKENGMSVGQIASKVNRDQEKVRMELRILADNNLIEVEISPNGKIKRAKINVQGANHFKEEPKIVTKESVKEQITDLKNRISSLEKAFEALQENPTEENKRTFLEKFDTLQSVANGVAPVIKAGLELFK
jgi:DNA-binding MarR family transcriptional regulator